MAAGGPLITRLRAHAKLAKRMCPPVYRLLKFMVRSDESQVRSASGIPDVAGTFAVFLTCQIDLDLRRGRRGRHSS